MYHVVTVCDAVIIQMKNSDVVLMSHVHRLTYLITCSLTTVYNNGLAFFD
jgi:hypothetical protein